MNSEPTESESSESVSSESTNFSSVPSNMDHHQMRPPSSYSALIHPVQRTNIEMQLIAQAASSLMSCVDTYKHRMATSQTAYFYSEARSLVNHAIQKKALKRLKHASRDRTVNSMMNDSASVSGGSIVGAPSYFERYPPTINHTLRAPSVNSVIPPVPPRPFLQPHQDPQSASTTSGYSSLEMPSDSFCFKVNPIPEGRRRKNNTLMQAINEVEDDESDEEGEPTVAKPRSRNDPSKKKMNSNHQARETDTNHGSNASLKARGRLNGEKSDEPSPAKSKPKVKPRSSAIGQEKKRQKSPPHSESDESDEPSPAKSKPKVKPRSSAIGQEKKRQKSPPHSDSDESDTQSPAKSTKTVLKGKSKSVLKLHEWRLRVIGEDMVIAGFLPDRSKAISGPIKRYSHPVIVAENGEYAVEGPAYIGTTIPSYIAAKCKNGFPRQWKALTRRWIDDIAAKEKKQKKGSTPRVQNRKDESKASNKGLSKKPKEPRPSATSTPNKSEKVKKGKDSTNNPRKRLSKSMDQSTSESRSENQKTVVKPRQRSEVNEPKKKELASRPKESKLHRKAASKGIAEQQRARLFGDGSSEEEEGDFQIDPFSNLGGDDRISLGKMTPNSLMKSIEADQGDLGRHTPPMQRIQHLFESGTKSLASTASPSSLLDTSRDNPVAKRMNKDLVEKKRKPKTLKKEPKSDRENRDPRIVEALKFLEPSNQNMNMRTPNIVKKVLRHQSSDSGTDSEQDLDESMAF